jgi:hypothetical protein
MIQQLIFTCCLVSAPQPITTLHPLSSCTFIPPSALQIRPCSALRLKLVRALSAILYFLNRFFISRSISVSPNNLNDNASAARGGSLDSEAAAAAAVRRSDSLRVGDCAASRCHCGTHLTGPYRPGASRGHCSPS